MLYYIEFFGDLHGHKSEGYNTLEDALEDLAREWGWLHQEQETDKWGNRIGWTPQFIPDPEDDRVVVWEVTPEGHHKAVWHFSGWHWPFDASDLPGGPLDQGCLPIKGAYREGRSLYELAMEDY